MNYKRIYESIVARGKERVIEGYKERHHIIPRCMGGTDDPNNLVDLTPEEHYVCHQLLVKIYPDDEKLMYAAKMMSLNSNGLRPTNKLYKWLKDRFVKAKRKRTSSKEVECVTCSKKVIVPKSYVTKYCSKECFGKSKRRYDIKWYDINCEQCGKAFTVTRPSNSNRFCTKQCYWQSVKGKPYTHFGYGKSY
jgi:hypothetical protein